MGETWVDSVRLTILVGFDLGRTASVPLALDQLLLDQSGWLGKLDNLDKLGS